MHLLQLPKLEPGTRPVYTATAFNENHPILLNWEIFCTTGIFLRPNIFLFCVLVIFKAQNVKVLGNKAFAACFIRTMLSSANGH